MNYDLTFGKCLKFFLSTLDLSMKQLAKNINIDSSLVSRWVTGNRIPSYSYLDSIAEYLSKLSISPIQLKLINELADGFDENICSTTNTNKERIYCILYHSLNHSLALQNKKKIEEDPDILSRSLKNAVNLSQEDKLIYGTEDLFHVFVTLLDRSIHDNQNQNKRIYLTYCNNSNTKNLTKSQLDIVKKKLFQAIQNHCEIIFLLRFDGNITSVMEFIHYILPLIKTGHIKLYFMTHHENVTISKDFYIVSGIGALSCFPSNDSLDIDCAFLLTTSAAIDVLVNYADLLIKSTTTDIIKYYKNDLNGLYFSTLSTMEEKNGNQYSYNNSFSKLLIPPDLYNQFLNKTDLTTEEKTLSSYYYKKRYNGFCKTLTHYTFMDIYFTSILDTLCEEKIITLYTYAGTKVISIETQDIITYLENVKNIIKTYPNYHITLVYSEPESMIADIALFIKERQMVFLNVYDKKYESTVRLSMDDPIVVKAFVHYYKGIWKNISPLNKDKNDILSVIDDYIGLLENQ